jgi:hypothetical protein
MAEHRRERGAEAYVADASPCIFIAGPAGESQSLDRLFHNLFAGLGLDAALVW